MGVMLSWSKRGAVAGAGLSEPGFVGLRDYHESVQKT